MQGYRHILFLILLVSASGLFAQTKPSPYAIQLKKETPLALSGLGLSAAGFVLEKNMDPRRPEDITGISTGSQFYLDKTSIDQYSTHADRFSDHLLHSSLILPLSLMVDKDIRNDAGKIAVLLSESTLLTFGFTNLTKVVVQRNRPYIHNPNVPIEDKLTPNGQLSFFSGHTSVTANLSFFTAKVWTDYHPDSKLKPLIWTAAATLPAVTGYLRYKAGKHYVTDVVSGYAVGALLGYFIPHLHKIDKKQRKKLRLSATSIDNVPVFSVRMAL